MCSWERVASQCLAKTVLLIVPFGQTKAWCCAHTQHGRLLFLVCVHLPFRRRGNGRAAFFLQTGSPIPTPRSRPRMPAAPHSSRRVRTGSRCKSGFSAWPTAVRKQRLWASSFFGAFVHGPRANRSRAPGAYPIPFAHTMRQGRLWRTRRPC